ncbi:ClpXP protease specificity-enhancing factor [Glaciimonas soli]|uniref:ClpXP protease specificity-enhancing factor n=1 Tax=Glaciimonas soli TaxID=2590999 RepID=A0A843YRG7_9BURK|nr:ClpXP protease specificity-enhancing factor [Glaciimonas soli]MQR00324.1 ClpXP protease specificity-enhancing factor [Glaciimonas soli]
MSETIASTKPYLLRAIYEWCTDNGFTPYLLAQVDANTRVPQQFVKDGEIVLNISFDATSGLKMDNHFVNFNARFSGVSREISVPIENVMAIYARENGQGMAFEVTKSAGTIASTESDEDSEKELQFEKDESNSNSTTPVFAVVPTLTSVPKTKENTSDSETDPEPPKNNGKKPTLTRIK